MTPASYLTCAIALLAALPAAAAEAPPADDSKDSVAAVADFLVKPGQHGAYLAPGEDPVAYAAVVESWAGDAQAYKVRTLAGLSRDPALAAPLHAALANWTKKPVKNVADAGAFLDEAAERAMAVAASARERGQLSVERSEDLGIPVPESVAVANIRATERARQLRERTRVSRDAFGPERRDDAPEQGTGGRTGSSQSGSPGGTSSPSGATRGAVDGAATPRPAPPPIPDSARVAAQAPRSFRRSAAEPPALSGGGATTPAGTRGAALSTEGGGVEGKPASGEPSVQGQPEESDEAVIRRVFSATVSQLTSSGQRASGSGTASGVFNNFSTLWNDKRMRCFDQAEVLQGKLNEAFAGRPSRARWSFELRSYTGDKDHEKNGHWWVQASSKDWPRQKTLTLDPWANTVKVEDAQNPVVIKPYAAYWMGYVMDKVTN